MLRITMDDSPRALTLQLEGLGNALASFLRKLIARCRDGRGTRNRDVEPDSGPEASRQP